MRRAISLTGQYAAVDETQTGEENLRMMGRLTGRSRADARLRAAELLERFGLTEAARRTVRTYSGGMRRRLDPAAGPVGSPQPEVFFLDEPTTGLDPRSRQELWQVVRDLATEGATVLLTTQYLEEADRLADRIAVLDRGRKVAEGTADALKSRVGGHRLDLVMADRASYLRLTHRAVHHAPATLTLGLPPDGSAAQVRALLDEIDPGRHRDRAVHPAQHHARRRLPGPDRDEGDTGRPCLKPSPPPPRPGPRPRSAPRSSTRAR
ncbi:Daunorubicin/doxorubicin resistance ATP-binding protein DrrA [Streptomyces sp. ADI92-24]|nr:Daunorubicin/doxorubicin resistance ATP-binding protein DrrA [Streptomyces sp. ADI92-24]